MKKRKVAWILAMAMTVTSIDSTALMAGAAELASEEQESLPEDVADVSDEGTLTVEDVTDESNTELAYSDVESADTESKDAEADLFSSGESELQSEEMFQDVYDTDTSPQDSGSGTTITHPGFDTQIVEGMDFTAEIKTEGEEAWFLFHPDEDGTYIFMTDQNTAFARTYADLCGDADLNEKPYLAGDEISGNWSHLSRITYNLEAGKNYYYRTRLDYGTGSYKVRVVKASEDYNITSVTLNADNARKQYVQYKDYVYATGAELTFHYQNAPSQTVTVTQRNALPMDTYGHKIEYAFWDSNGNFAGAAGYNVKPGTYKIRFKVEGYTPADEDSLSYGFTADDPWVNITEGSTQVKRVYLPDDAMWYKFVPSKSGTYTFDSPGWVNVIDRDNNFSDVSGSSNREYILEKDRVYYVRFYSMNTDGQSDTADVTITRIPEVERIQITSTLGESVAGLGSYTEATISVSFDNGTTKEGKLTFGSSIIRIDEMVFEPYLIDTDGDEHEVVDILPAGDYKLIFRGGNNISSDPVPFAIKEITDSVLYHGAINSGREIPVISPYNRRAYYSFTAPETDRYCISDITASYYDIYKKTDNGYQSIKDEGIQDLEAGTTIFFKFYGGGVRGENATLSLLKRQNITAMSFPEKEYIQIEGVNAGNLIPEDLGVDYADGSHNELGVPFSKPTLEDDMGNTINVEWLYEDENGNFNTCDWSTHGGAVAGEYKVIFTAGTVCGEIRLSILSVAKDAERLPQLKMGRQKLHLNDYGTNYYIFTPEKDGYYSFKYSNLNGNASIGLWDEENNKLPYLGQLSDDRELTGGSKYFVLFDSLQEQNLNLYIYKQPVATSVEILSGWDEDNVFIAEFGSVYIDDLQARVKMDDGTEEVLYLGEVDQYDNRLEGWLYRQNEDGTLDTTPSQYYDSVSAGDYLLKVRYGDKESEQGIPVKVISLKDFGAPVLESDKKQTASLSSKYLVYQFTPETSGVYELEVNTEVSLTLHDEDGKYLLHSDNETSDMTFNLEAGKTYFFNLYTPNEYGPDVQLCIKSVELPVKLETTLLENVTYIPGIDCFSDVKLQTVAIYENGRREKVKSGDQIAGYDVNYIVESESDEYDFDDLMESGTFTITPVLMKNDKALSIAATGVEIKAEKPQVTEILTPGQWTDVKETYRHLYRFTADKESTYLIRTEEGASASFYREMSNRLKHKGQMYQLDEGESCIVAVSAYKNSRICVVDMSEDKPEQPGTSGEIILTDGFSREVTVDAGGEQIFVFTPTVSGYYRIKSEGDVDTKVELYAGETQVADDDDSGVGTNFSLKSYLEAGKTYRYKASLYSSTKSGTFTVCFDSAQEKDISKLELVVKEGLSTADFTIFTYPSKVYNLKITYQDGSEKIIDLDFSSMYDDFGNEIGFDLSLEADGDPETNEMFFAYELLYRKENSNVWQGTTSGKISVGCISDIDALEIGTPKTTSLQGSQSRVYRFTVPEDGNYFIHFASGNSNISLSTEFYSYYTYFKLGQWDMNTNHVPRNDSGLVSLSKGEKYIVYLDNYSPENTGEFSFYIGKAETLENIELKKTPDDLFVYPNADESISLDGMVITAHYGDGSSKDITYGETDSAGRYIRILYRKWIGNDTLRVTFAFGECRSFVDLKAAATDQLPVLKTGETMNLPASRTQLAALRYSPEESGYYSLDTDRDGWIKVVEEETGRKVQESNGYYLEAGKFYQIYLSTANGDDSITVLRGVCEWTEEPEIMATCTENGSVTYRCDVHNHTKTFPTQEAYGHTFGEWITTREAGCETEGEQQRSCTRCHAVENRSLPAKGQHSFGAWTITKESTVLEAGVQERICSQCGKKETASLAKLESSISLSVRGTIPLKVKQSYKVKVTMGKGDKVLSWKSSNSKAVSVKNGVIKGLKAGKKATITVRIKSGKVASFKVKVQKTTVKTTKLTVTDSTTKKKVGKTVALKKGKTLKLAVAAAPVTSQQKITYISSNKKIVSVTKTGVIKARKKGKATVTVKSGSKAYRIKINVK